jgi:hypothetical protein
MGFAPNVPLDDVMANPLAAAIAENARLLYVAREAALTSGPRPIDMTELYDLRAQGGASWLDLAHRRLDISVAAAYEWPLDLTDAEVLAALGSLHQQRSGAALGAEDNGSEGAQQEPDTPS